MQFAYNKFIYPGICMIWCLLYGSTCSRPVSLNPQQFQNRNKAVEYLDNSTLKNFEDLIQREYRLQAGDVLRLHAPQIQTDVEDLRINPDGTIYLSPAPEIKIAGLTRSEAEQLLLHKFSIFYKVNHLSLYLKTLTGNQISVAGAVRKPGIFKFSKRPTLFDVLAQCGLHTETVEQAGVKSISILRADAILTLPLQQAWSPDYPYWQLPLDFGDRLLVTAANKYFVVVLGEVRRPGRFSIKVGDRLLDIIGAAGGFSEDANRTQIRLIRRSAYAGKSLQNPQEVPATININFLNILNQNNFNKDFLLQSGDIIYVPRNGLAGINYFFRMINPLTQLIIIQRSPGGDE